jgi:hypothetical protein
MDTAQFVNGLNVERFVDRLRFEHDPTVRRSLRRLLLEEEDKLGLSLERLGKVQHHIGEGRARIARQKILIERLVANGHDARFAENLLRNFIEVNEILERHYRTILDAIRRSQAMDLNEPFQALCAQDALATVTVGR